MVLRHLNNAPPCSIAGPLRSAPPLELLAIARKDQQWKGTAHFNFSRRKN
jgi:hypothetical protein